MIDRFQIQKLTDLPVESVASRLGLEVSHHKCLCPFHDDKHPSLTFNIRHNTYRCFVCGEYGNTISLVMKMQHLGFPDACKWLAEGTSVIMDDDTKRTDRREVSYEKHEFDASRYLRFFEHPWLTETARHFLFDERHLDHRVVEWCRITSWKDIHGINWLQTPYYDMDGRLIGIQSRNLDYHKDRTSDKDVNCAPRFRFPYGSRCCIYNLPVIKMLRPYEPLYITEGCSDCWSMLSAGHKAIAIPSATLLKPSDVEIIGRLKCQGTSFHIFPDQDEPGERLFLQLREMIPDIVRHQLPAGCKDYSEYYLMKISNLKS